MHLVELLEAVASVIDVSDSLLITGQIQHNPGSHLQVLATINRKHQVLDHLGTSVLT